MADPTRAKGTKGKLLDAEGRVTDQGLPRPRSCENQAIDYIRMKPISTVLVALGAGYILGRLKIL